MKNTFGINIIPENDQRRVDALSRYKILILKKFINLVLINNAEVEIYFKFQLQEILSGSKIFHRKLNINDQ